MSEMDSTATPAQGPATQYELLSLRATFAAIFIGAVVLGAILARVLMARVANIPLSPGLFLVVEFIWIMLWLLPSMAIIELARRVNLPRWPLIIPISVWPIINWIALALVLGYTLEHLRLVEITSKPRWLWIIIGGAPIALMVLMTVISPAYMSQMVLGPPVGEIIPMLGIPCGWPLLAGFVVLTSLANYSLWLGISHWPTGRFAILATALLTIALLIFPAVWTALLGPAAVQLFKQFFSSP